MNPTSPTSPSTAAPGRGSRAGAIVTLLAGAALVLLAAYRPAWFTDDVSDASIGLRTMSICLDGGCRSESLGTVAGDPSWARTGMAAFASSLLAAALAVTLAGTVAAGRLPRFLARITVVAAVATAGAGAVFVLQFPGYGNASLASSAWLHFAGAALITLGWGLQVRMARAAR